LRGFAGVLLAGDRHQEAARAARRAVALSQQIGDPIEQVPALQARTLVALAAAAELATRLGLPG
jgi:hypothetical protein